MIAAIMEETKTKEWSRFLPLIQYNLNTQKSSSTKFMPFEVVFKTLPNMGKKKSIFY